MPISEAELIAGIETKNGFPLDGTQQDAIRYGDGPLLVPAGPGTGKTEVLVARCLKLMLCDDVNPGSIMLTTFTEKAARNLEDRLSETFLYLVGHFPVLMHVDPSALRVGTLHGLCNDILQEYRYVDYQNLRLLDDVEDALLIHRKVVSGIGHLKNALYSQFTYLFNHQQEHKLGKWGWALPLQKLFGRMVDDQVDGALMAADGPGFAALQQADAIYEQALIDSHACDFSRLLRKFREFLDTPQGNLFLNGDGSGVRLPLTHILVDEYQDTNPIQESIYLRMSDGGHHNISIVGDDDQALYRFRGGTVECMVGFAAACAARWGTAPAIIYLADNHRSDERIVDWCNAYISSFPQMGIAGVRIAGKPPLVSSVGISGPHPAVSLIREAKVGAVANSFATLVRELLANGIVEDYSQCVLLLRSAKNSARFAQPFVNALQAHPSVPVYNPRSKDFLEQAEVRQCLGAFVRIIDPDLTHIATITSPSIQGLVTGWALDFDAIAATNAPLADYVSQSAVAIQDLAHGKRITPAMPTILYRILSHEPFVGYQGNPEMDLRLSKLSRLFESFCAQYGRQLWTDDVNDGVVSERFSNSFYYGLCGYMSRKGLDDDEDIEVVCPVGYFPIMTVHQAKGLEFDFVFVGNLGSSVSESDSHRLEKDFRPFRVAPPAVSHAVNEACWHDEVRQHFVAYSRARKAVVLLTTDGQLRKKGHETASFGVAGGNWVRQNVTRL
jgi:DNA helicase-2/ATP-dependent DNA helicase PcrA